MQWLMLIIPPTQEAEIKRMVVSGWPRQKVRETLSQQTSQVWWWNVSNHSFAGGVSRRITV
jgi:hypothetical protein